MIEVEHRPEENNHREKNNYGSNHFVDDDDTIDIKPPANLYDKPSQPIPPQQCTQRDAGKANCRLHGARGLHKSKLGESGHEEEDDERIGECYQKSRQGIME